MSGARLLQSDTSILGPALIASRQRAARLAVESCPDRMEVTDVKGLQTIPSESSVEQTTDNLIGNIEDQGWHLFARINHAAQAKGKGLELRPTEVVLFGNPEIGTLLMQDRQTAAIDLPVKALVWQDANDQVFITYNTMPWLKDRHALTDDATLDSIARLVEKVCRDAARS